MAGLQDLITQMQEQLAPQVDSSTKPLDFNTATDVEVAEQAAANAVGTPSATTSTKLLLEQRQKANDAKGDATQDRLVLENVNTLLDQIQVDESGQVVGDVPGFGPIQSVFYAPKEADRGAFGKLAAGIASTNNESSVANTVRNFLLSNEYAQAYDTLKGGGHITEFEAKTVANAISLLGSTTINDQTAYEELVRIRGMLNVATQRAEKGIFTNTDGQEFLGSEDQKDRQPIFSYMVDGVLQVEPTNGQNIRTLHQSYTEDQKKRLYDQAPAGTVFIDIGPDGNAQKFAKPGDK